MIKFYEAGVVNGSSVLVLTRNAAKISILRNTFGPYVYGLGEGDPMMLEQEAESRNWDFIFSEDTIKQKHGKFSEQYKAMYSEFVQAMYKLNRYKGQKIIYVTPLLFFSREFWDDYGIKQTVKVPKRPENGWIMTANNSYSNYTGAFKGRVGYRGGDPPNFRLHRDYTMLKRKDIEGYVVDAYVDLRCIS